MIIFFGGAIVAATYWTSPESPTSADLVVRGFNELLFPVGCSLVLFSAQALGKRLAANWVSSTIPGALREVGGVEWAR